jgi:hypothetical protein
VSLLVQIPFGLATFPSTPDTTRYGEPGSTWDGVLSVTEQFYICPNTLTTTQIIVKDRVIPSLLSPVPPAQPVIVTFTLRRNGSNAGSANILLDPNEVQDRNKRLQKALSCLVAYQLGDRLSLAVSYDQPFSSPPVNVCALVMARVL